MTRNYRRIIFLFLVLLFFVVTPGVILFASGFSFDWQKWQLVKTGALFFKSAPKDAKIIINGQLRDTTPGFIDHLAPERYAIEISKDGYFPWEKNLYVRPQETTEARNIVLVPQKPQALWVADNVTSTKDYFLSEQEKLAGQKAADIASSSLKDIWSFALFENQIYYLQGQNPLLYKTELSASSRQQLSFAPAPRPKIAYQIIVSPERLAIFEEQGEAYLLNPETKSFELLSDGVCGLEFSSDNQKLLFWTDHEIWAVWLKESLGQPQREPGNKELIARYGDKISRAVWFSSTNENEHIIYTVVSGDKNTKIKFTELDGRDSRNTYDIYNLYRASTDIYFNQQDKLLYFLSEHKLYSLRILEKDSFF